MKFKENAVAGNKKTNMYIKNIKKEVTTEQFKDILGRYGDITSVCLKEWKNKLMGTLENNEVLKFGFVNFKSHESATNLLANHQKD